MLAVVLTAAMIRCVPFLRWYASLFCEVCGDTVAHVTVSGDQLCGSCLADRRAAYRVQNRAATIESARAVEATKADMRRKERKALMEYEGESTSYELAAHGYFDEFYEEWSPTEFTGAKPRWIEEPTHRATELKASLAGMKRARTAKQWTAYIGPMLLPKYRRLMVLNWQNALSAAWYVDDRHRDLTTMYDGTDDRDMGEGVLAWLKRDPSDKAILNRWFRPDDELEFMDRLREEGRESEWWELMVDFRRRKLDGLLKEYFGLDNYRASMIVLKWEKGASGRWKPAKQMNVVDWVKWSCEQSGSTLGGLQSCTRSIQVKTQLRKRKEARNALAA